MIDGKGETCGVFNMHISSVELFPSVAETYPTSNCYQKIPTVAKNFFVSYFARYLATPTYGGSERYVFIFWYLHISTFVCI